MLIAYFSWGGDVKKIAETIQSKIGGDIFVIDPVKAYSKDYNTCLKEATKDKKEGKLPELKNRISDLKGHDAIVLAFPNWWSSIPRPVATFLTEYDFSGKIVAPVCSHGGGGLAEGLNDIKKLIPKAEVKEPLILQSGGGSSLGKDVDAWLKKIGLAKAS
jgi:flavodoxin